MNIVAIARRNIAPKKIFDEIEYRYRQVHMDWSNRYQVGEVCMDAIPPRKQNQEKREKTKDSLIRYVDGLAHEKDSWMSLTDAARVTRTSEAMVRRWVTSGRLPIKREAAGLNQRTRLVRASDVQEIRPIIDPEAAISDDIRTLDLPSIPRQYFQLMEEHRQLSSSITSIQNMTTRASSDLEQFITKSQEEIETLRQQLFEQHSSIPPLPLHDQQQYYVLITQIQDQIHLIIEDAKELGIRQDKQKDGFQELLTIHHEKTIHQVSELLAALERDIVNQTRKVAMIDECIEKITEQLERVAIQTNTVQDTLLALQKRNDIQDKLVRALDKMLQEKVEERKIFFEQLLLLRQDIDKIKNK